MWLFGGACGVLAIGEYTISASLGPIGFLILQAAMVFSFFGKTLRERISNH
jgi:hypothetical protein